MSYNYLIVSDGKPVEILRCDTLIRAGELSVAEILALSPFGAWTTLPSEVGVETVLSYQHKPSAKFVSVDSDEDVGLWTGAISKGHGVSTTSIKIWDPREPIATKTGNEHPEDLANYLAFLISDKGHKYIVATNRIHSD